MDSIKEKVMDFCRSPIPRSGVEIARHVKEDFYPRTPDAKAVRFLIKEHLGPLVEQGFLVSYSPADSAWEKARGLLRYARLREGSKPRGVRLLYQINFMCLLPPKADTPYPALAGLPAPQKEMNLDLVTLLSRFFAGRDVDGNEYLWNLINLFCCFLSHKDALLSKIDSIPFSSEERMVLRSVSEYSDAFRTFAEGFPFSPSLEKAMGFLETF